jgi:hypothetical protein
VILADGFSCRTQLDQLGERGGRHLAELLAEHLPDRVSDQSPAGSSSAQQRKAKP